jgi:hypothetical protein
MHARMFLGLAVTSLFLATSALAANYADSVVAYNPGTGYAIDTGTGLGYTNAAVVLGSPSTVTPGQFGGPVDPFNPPYLREQIVSIGAGGSLTLGLSTPILNSASNPFGIDFMIFGNSGFVITNNNFSGGGITDGSVFGGNSPVARVSVSADGVTFYQLDPSRAPALDGLYPTDGSGNFSLPVNPSLKNANFSGQDLAGIRALYNGSGGGAGFDISWAEDSSGHSVALSQVDFVRIDVLSGAADIDGLSAVESVPEPAGWALLGLGLIVLMVPRSLAQREG